MGRFRERCLTEKPPIICGPLLDLTDLQQIEDLLEKIVRDLEEQAPPQSFSDFTAKLKKYHDTAAGRTTGAERALGIARGVAAGAAGIAGTAGVPGATLAKTAIESSAVGEALELAKESISGHGDLKSVIEAFFSDRGGLRDYVTHAHTRGMSTLEVFLLDSKSVEAELDRVSKNKSEREPIYGFQAAGLFLRSLGVSLARARAASQSPALMTTNNLRPHLRRLIAAQFPRLSIVSYQELSQDVGIQPLERIIL